MIDPFTAMAAVTTAVKLIKKAAATVDDVRSLGPLLGRYFDAKDTAIKAANEAKANGGFKGSNMGKAMELELAIENSRKFEEEVKMLFFQSNNMDVWEKIMIRRNEMNKADKAAELKAEKAARKRKQELDEMVELCFFGALGVVLVGAFCWGGWELLVYCKTNGCG